MNNSKNVLLSLAFSHPHSSAGRKLRLLYKSHLQAENWTVFTGSMNGQIEGEIVELPSLADAFWKPVSSSKSGSTKKSIKIFIKKMLLGVLIWPDVGIFWSLKNFRKLKKIIKKEKKVNLVAVSYPFSSLVTAARLKCLNPKKIHLTVHYVDSFYLTNYGNGTAFFYRPLNLLLEKFVNKNADKIIINLQKKEAYQKQFPQYLSKTHFIEELPNSLPSKVNAKSQDSKRIMFFAGTLYESIRNPEAALNVLSQVEGFDVYFAGNLNDSTNRVMGYVKKFEHINYLGMLSADELRDWYSKTAIFVNIDNSDLNQQAPGKIFEYMLHQKTILNFYETQSLSGPILTSKAVYNDSYIEIKTKGMSSLDANTAVQSIKELDLKTKKRFLVEDGYESLFQLYMS